ncbi:MULTISPECIES: flagellar basal body rod protein FlgB [Thalassomonas]|uniref:Flagellar basal body rod protein FlgB n=2 Tax=Thalassomonas TaxID=137583 RepID=A0AAF0C3X3_9GAMM|nr:MULTISPECIES: flagellar basal body rod protein FlgB [Thalassomonas]WDD99323.1 flagellar basal body rod protein FlgB [Thalassomonas actiniarum]WDE05170.1 flagellar basal body rod protein FlgB [Thalassomonas viridans]
MAINFDKALGIHPYALQARVQRSEILASNLANVDTPGYLARDYDFKAAMADVESQFNNSGSGFVPQLSMEAQYRVPYQPALDGNTAEMGVEQSKFNNNAMDFQSSLTFLNMKIQGLQKVIDGR